MAEGADLYRQQLAWESEEQDSFRALGERLRDSIPREHWPTLSIEERQERFEGAARLVREGLELRRPTPILWTDDRENEGAGYDQHSEPGEVHYPAHHLDTAEPAALVRGLVEEMRHSWHDDVHRGLREHPVGAVGKLAIDHGFAIYNEENPQDWNPLEEDAKRRAEWAVDGYLGSPREED